MDSDIPDGFTLVVRHGTTFMGLVGPIYSKPRPADGQPILGLRVEPKHQNLRGIVHGGMLMTLADSSLGHAINYVRRVPLGLVTVSLTTKFIESAKLGDWIEAHVDVERIGTRMAFANSTLIVGAGASCMRARCLRWSSRPRRSRWTGTSSKVRFPTKPGAPGHRPSTSSG